MKRIVCRRDELGPGEMRTIMKGNAPVVVVCSAKEEYYAVRGVCPHQGGMLGAGQLAALTISDAPGVYRLAKTKQVLRCPWHSFDYDVKTGRCVGDPHLRVKTYPVSVENGEIVVDL